MSCAYFLANMSYPVTVFDKDPIPGGMLTKGIPSFRLEKDIVNAEIDVLREMGVEFKCDVEVGKDVTIPELREPKATRRFISPSACKRPSASTLRARSLTALSAALIFCAA